MKELRVLLATDAVGGVWVYSLELARALKAHGVEAVLAAMGPSPSDAQREEAVGLRLIDSGLPLDWIDTSPGELSRAGEALVAIARHEGADLVQTCSAALLADAEFDVPAVAVQHSCVASWWEAVKGTPLPAAFEWRRELVERGLKRAAAVVAPSAAFAAQTARIYGVDVRAVHNGRRRPAVEAQDKSAFVLTASRLWDEGKNVATLDAAAASLRVPFIAAGPTEGPNGTRAELRNLQGIGQVSSGHLSSLLAARPVFASAAVYEPFGLTALEAAHAGCALVLSDIATHRELWDGAALFIPAGDAEGFAAAIQHLLSHPDDRRAMGELAKDRAQRFLPERMARGMAEICARIALPAIEDAPLELAGAA